MNQIPNIEETYNTREVEEIKINWKAIAAKKLMDSGVSPKTTAELILTLEGLFHHQLQKAREEERERIRKALQTKLSHFYGASTVVEDYLNPVTPVDDLTNK